MIVSAVVGLVGGGAAGAFITSRAQIGQLRRTRRHEAASALWAYQRALMGFGNRMWDKANGDVDSASVSVADFAELRRTHASAYPYAGYLPSEQQALVRDAHFEFGGEPGGSPDADANVADSAFDHGRKLEKVLIAVFRRDDR
jgi:hypothetical protein